MDNLQEIVQGLPEDACHHFLFFARRLKQKKDRKDLLLFQLMRDSKASDSKKYMMELYGRHEPNSYHAIRKRLFKQLTDFLVLYRMEEDTTGAAKVMGILSLIRYLFEQKNDRLGWHYLRKGERMAWDNEQYDLLNTLYRLQIGHADSEFAPELSLILEQRDKSRSAADKEERAELAFIIIKRKLEKVRLESRTLDFERHISEVLRELGLEQEMQLKPKYLYHMLSMVRSVILAKKDFHAFEPYMIQQYQLLERAGAFTKAYHYYKLSILYMLCHVLYRNRKFEAALAYLQKMEQGLKEFKGAFGPKFQVKYTLLLSGVNSYLGDSSTAIRLLEDLLKDCTYLKEEERLGTLLNVGLYYFQQGNLKQANAISVRIGHSDYWCEKKMGREWLMKKHLMELIVQYELGHTDIVALRLKQFHKRYQDLYDHPIYQRVEAYVGFIHRLITEPDCYLDEAYQMELMTGLTRIAKDREDLQAITFYSWLKSKFLQKDFYDTLQETVGT